MIPLIPYLRFAGLYKHTERFSDYHVFPKRKVYYYELEYFINEGTSKMVLDDVTYTFSGNSVIFRKPGQINQSYMPYESYTLCFTFDPLKTKDLLSFDFDVPHKMQVNYYHPLINEICTVNSNLSIQYDVFFKTIYNEILKDNPLGEALYTSYILQILYHLNKENESHVQTTIGGNYTIQHPMLMNIINYIDHNIHDRITITSISKQLSISERYIHELFREHMDITPNHYINLLKINMAKNLLLTSNLNINEIGYYCGFENTPYFSSLFKKKVGISPLKYRVQNK